MAVDTGVIAIWSGTLATIPANWNLCDGSGVTPNLVARFLRGAPAATNPGTTGGADSHTHSSMTGAGSHSHTLQSQSHSHTVNSAGDHGHGSTTAEYYFPGADLLHTVNGAHIHSTNSDSHSHSSGTDPNHTHTIIASDGRPPYYEVAFIQAAAGAACAAGLIIIWTGTLATIPAGWDLCDGSGGRPDLRSRFLRGVNTNVTNPGTTGGSTTHTHSESSRAHSHGGSSTTGDSLHSHSFNAYTWTHSHNVVTAEGDSARVKQTDSAAGSHTHANTDSTGSHSHSIGSGGSHSHSVNSASSLPVYYQVAYIYNTAAADFPAGGILIWTGTLATIPGNYNLCDGGDGRPDLRSRFLYGTSAGIDPGGTGGSNTHTHTDNAAGTHSNHSIGSTGSHQHSATNSTGSHTHSTTGSAFAYYSSSITAYPNSAGGSHSHTFNNENSHSHTDSSTGSHNHNPWSTDDGRPAYYEVAFIQYSGGAGPSASPATNIAVKMVSSGVI